MLYFYRKYILKLNQPNQKKKKKYAQSKIPIQAVRPGFFDIQQPLTVTGSKGMQIKIKIAQFLKCSKR